MSTNTDKRKLELKIVTKVVKTYRDGTKRCVDNDGACLYGDRHGKACALGSFLRPEVWKAIADLDVGDPESHGPDGRPKEFHRFRQAAAHQLVDAWNRFVGQDAERSVLELDDLLVPEARGLPVGFWTSLQNIHDEPRNWPLGNVRSKREVDLHLIGELEYRKLPVPAFLRKAEKKN